MVVGPLVFEGHKRRRYWLNLGNEAGDWLRLPTRTYGLTFQLAKAGPFGGTVRIEGSNDGVSTFHLTDVKTQSAAEFTDSGVFEALELPDMIRPVGGIGVEGVNVFVRIR